MLEILSFRLILDFFKRLSLFRMTLIDVRIFLYDKDTNKYLFYNFDTIEAVRAYYDEHYSQVSVCEHLGNIWGIDYFSVSCNLSQEFKSEYRARNVENGTFKLTPLCDFNIQCNDQWQDEYARQGNHIYKSVQEYRTHYKDLKDVYTKGIYAICYYVPPYGEQSVVMGDYATWLLDYAKQEQDKRDVTINEVEKGDKLWRIGTPQIGRTFALGMQNFGVVFDATTSGEYVTPTTRGNITFDTETYLLNPHPCISLTFDENQKLHNIYNKQLCVELDENNNANIAWVSDNGNTMALDNNTLTTDINGESYILVYYADTNKFAFAPQSSTFGGVVEFETYRKPW